MMEVLRETTTWEDATPNHTYLVDSTLDKMLGYIKAGTQDPIMFNNPLRFVKSRRKFDSLDISTSPFTIPETPSSVQQVVGSKGQVYQVDREANTCSCPGNKYRGDCKHLKMLVDISK
jgi:hypothetical protein